MHETDLSLLNQEIDQSMQLPIQKRFSAHDYKTMDAGHITQEIFDILNQWINILILSLLIKRN